MMTLWVMGFLIGMRHACEADHLAAVASLSTRSRSLTGTMVQGAVWGVGHTLTLFLFGGMVLVLDAGIPEHLAQGLEFAVGLMLIALGIDVIRRAAGTRLHVHFHRHADGTRHVHFHRHGRDPADAGRHDHGHPRRFPLRALLVGSMHGMAGSAALILLTLQRVDSPWAGLLYIALFGAGSLVGMALLSLVIALPLCYSAGRWSRLYAGLQGVIGTATVLLGAVMVHEIGLTQGLKLLAGPA